MRFPMHGLTGLAACAIAVAASRAQSTASSDEVVTLSPFQVTSEGDTGYRAANSLEGSRLNTPLRDTPGSISVFTKDFLDDIAATDLRDILRYDVNSEEGAARCIMSIRSSR
jgi:outer membrane receptor for monomeric catechols